MQNEIIKVLQEYIQKVRDKMSINNINASHRTEKSLRIVQTPSHYRVIIGGPKTAPAETLQSGRPPGPVPRNLQNILLDWLKDKGLPAEPAIANAIKWQIFHHGTKRYKHNIDIYSSAGLEVREKLQSALGTYFAKRLVKTK